MKFWIYSYESRFSSFRETDDIVFLFINFKTCAPVYQTIPTYAHLTIFDQSSKRHSTTKTRVSKSSVAHSLVWNYENMDKIVTENLFLLEFLVDSVTLDKKCECDAPPGETCVSFQFLDNAPLDVCEADFNPKRDMKGGDRETVKSGKSCLFSLSPEQAAAGTEQFDICVSVTKKMQPGWLPEKVELGTAQS